MYYQKNNQINIYWVYLKNLRRQLDTIALFSAHLHYTIVVVTPAVQKRQQNNRVMPRYLGVLERSKARLAICCWNFKTMCL